jgi:hypothetical protein
MLIILVALIHHVTIDLKLALKMGFLFIMWQNLVSFSILVLFSEYDL